MAQNNNKIFQPNSFTHFPIYRCELIRKGIEELLAKNEKNGIYYLSKSCFSQFLYEENARSKMDDFTLDSIASNIPQEDDGDILMSFITNELKEIKTLIESDFIENNENEDANIKQFYERCSKLPKEWNIVQITRLDDTYDAGATKEESNSVESPITISVFQHALSSKTKNEPIALNLGFSTVQPAQIYHSSYKLYMEEFKDYKKYQEASREKYNQKISAHLSELTGTLTKWLGPWIVLFAGKVKGENGKQFEKEIFTKVNELATKIGLTERQTILLSLVARRCDLLNGDKIKEIAEKFGKNRLSHLDIVKFFSQLRLNTTFRNLKYYPCLVILDQCMDYFPWEMLIPNQELARFNSIYMLLNLYETYKDDINDGYLKMNIKNGISLINPDQDEKLLDMSKRMEGYYSTSFPKWKNITDQKPTKNEMVEILQKSDLFVFSGHGSSLQYILPSDINKIHSKCVLFLFGCDSVALKIPNGNCEPYASHFDLFKTKCPAIIGAISIIIDNWADISTILILNQFNPIVKKWIPKYFGEHYVTLFKSLMKKLENIKEQSILAAMANVRCIDKMSLRMKAAMVYRGLPVMNTAIE